MKDLIAYSLYVTLTLMSALGEATQCEFMITTCDVFS